MELSIYLSTDLERERGLNFLNFLDYGGEFYDVVHVRFPLMQALCSRIAYGSNVEYYAPMVFVAGFGNLTMQVGASEILN